MGFKIKIIAMVMGLLFLFSVLMALRKKNFQPTNAILWILIALFLLSVPIIEPFYRWVAYEIIGIGDARHIIYVALIGFLLAYVFYITVRLNNVSDRVQELISELAILRNKLNGNGKGE